MHHHSPIKINFSWTRTFVTFLILPHKIHTSKGYKSSLFCNRMNTDKVISDLNLQQQWAGGRDIWPKVPLDLNPQNFTAIQTRVVESSSSLRSSSKWPDLVQSRILYGFGAYNPRGKIVAKEINQLQHERLKQDIVQSLDNTSLWNSTSRNSSTTRSPNHSTTLWWEGASIWQDGSWELGFILAFDKEMAEFGLELSVALAKKYHQGAIYKFEYVPRPFEEQDEDSLVSSQEGRLMRQTIPVLDEGTDALVEIEMEDKLTVDLSMFDE